MGQVGAKAESPMTLLREYATALSALLHGETVTAHGRYVHLDRVGLDWPPGVVPPLLVGGIRPRTVSLAGELTDGVIIPGGVPPEEVRAAVGHFRAGRAARPTAGPTAGAAAGAAADPGEVVVFISAPADSPARDIAATVSEYAAAGATCVAVNADEDDADIERFAGFLAREVSPLVR
jgi:alkanesulfonate monooxygenase SsuD/methylene tetrahydromethanopterin reductase-like flavin-dependent oxidoreductase (luciferase family)